MYQHLAVLRIISQKHSLSRVSAKNTFPYEKHGCQKSVLKPVQAIERDKVHTKKSSNPESCPDLGDIWSKTE